MGGRIHGLTSGLAVHGRLRGLMVLGGISGMAVQGRLSLAVQGRVSWLSQLVSGLRWEVRLMMSSAWKGMRLDGEGMRKDGT